jgi:hypothetical protein
VAATPIRKERLEVSLRKLRMQMLQFLPSSRAPNLPRVEVETDTELVNEACEPSQLYDPIVNGNQPITGFEHDDILSVARRVIEFMSGTNMPVSRGWLFEIVRVFNLLETQRRNLKQVSITLSSTSFLMSWRDGVV